MGEGTNEHKALADTGSTLSRSEGNSTSVSFQLSVIPVHLKRQPANCVGISWFISLFPPCVSLSYIHCFVLFFSLSLSLNGGFRGSPAEDLLECPPAQERETRRRSRLRGHSSSSPSSESPPLTAEDSPLPPAEIPKPRSNGCTTGSVDTRTTPRSSLIHWTSYNRDQLVIIRQSLSSYLFFTRKSSVHPS